MSKKILLMRSAFVFLALSGLACSAYYGINLVKREYHANKMNNLVEGFENAAMSRKASKATLQYLGATYWPEIATAREAFLGSDYYWKTVHISYYNAARSLIRERKEGVALSVLTEGLAIHPYFPNGYELIANIYEGLGVTERAERCRAVSQALLDGNKVSLTDTCECMSREGCL